MTNDTALIISIVAAVISAVSMSFSVYNVIRDRAKISVRSHIFYDRSRSMEPGPSMSVRIVNAGRRPIVLTHVVKTSPQGNWFTPIKHMEFDATEKVVFIGAQLVQKPVAQNISLRLAEGEAFEIVIHHDDRHEFYGFFDDEIREAQDLYIEDVLGRRYLIKDAKQHLSKLKAYKEPACT